MEGQQTTSEQYLFMDTLIVFGGPVAKTNDLPTSAMVACGIVESGYGRITKDDGTETIYKRTGCPFNLQRPSWYAWVKCNTISIRTCTATKVTDGKRECIEWKIAPFCVASGNDEGERLADSARLWCEWILGWPQKAVRDKMLSLRHKPEEFTLNLPSVGFGEASKHAENSQKFLAALRKHAIVARCDSIL